MGCRRTIANTKHYGSNLHQLCANYSFANSDTNTNSYSDTNTDSNRNTNTHLYSHANFDGYSHTNTNPDSHASTNSNVNNGSNADRDAYPDPVRNTDARNNSTNSNPESNTNSNISISARTKTNYFANATNKPWPNNYATTDTTTNLLPLLFPQTLLVHVQLVTLQHMVLLLPLNLEKFPFLFCKNQKIPTIRFMFLTLGFIIVLRCCGLPFIDRTKLLIN
jgi:hypothetical protein